MPTSFRGDVLKAIEYYDQALAISREIGDRRSEGMRSWKPRQCLLPFCGDVHKAIEYYDQALAISREIGEACEVKETTLATWAVPIQQSR